MGYWRSVGRRAWREAAKAVGLETTERMIVALIIQCVFAIAIFGALGQTDLQDSLAARLVTAAIPFLVVPFVFLVKFMSLPPRIDAELRLERHGAESNTNSGITELRPHFRIDAERRSLPNGSEVKINSGAAIARPCLTIPRLIARPKQQGYQIEVENAGADHLDNCSVKVTSIEGLDKNCEVQMPLILMTGGGANRSDGGSFNLRPGEKKPIGLLTEAQGKMRIFCEGSGFEDFGFMKECLVHVTAFGPATPTHAKIHVEMADSNQLRATLLPTEPPLGSQLQ